MIRTLLKQLVAAVLLAAPVSAWAGIIPVGEAATTTSNTYGPMRLTTTVGSFRAGYIYPQAVLTGLNPGDTVYALSFKRNGNNALPDSTSFKLYVEQETITTFPTGTYNWATNVATLTPRFEGKVGQLLGSDAGWETITLTTPLVINATGGTNLKVFVEYIQFGTMGTASTWFYANSTLVPAFQTRSALYSSSTTTTPPTNATTATAIHPVVRFHTARGLDAEAVGLSSPDLLTLNLDRNMIVRVASHTNSTQTVQVTVSSTQGYNATKTMVLPPFSVVDSVLPTYNQNTTAGFDDFTITVNAPGDVIADNNSVNESKTLYNPYTKAGQFVNVPLSNTHSGTFPVSSITTGLDVYGQSVTWTANNGGSRMSDDFTVPAGQTWNVDTIVAFAYKTLAPADSNVFNRLTIQIFTGVPNTPGFTRVFGDDTTNRLTTQLFSGIFRTDANTSAVTNQDRAIKMLKAATPGLTLPAGYYWIEFSVGSKPNSFTGPWYPYANVNNILHVGNAMQRTGRTAFNVQFGGNNLPEPTAIPFIIAYNGGNTVTGSRPGLSFGKLTLYPNPARNQVSVAQLPAGHYSVRIMTLTGAVLSETSQNHDGSELNIGIDQLPAGMYLLQLSGNGHSQTLRFSKE